MDDAGRRAFVPSPYPTKEDTVHTATEHPTASKRSQSWLMYGVVAFTLATALSAIGVFAGERNEDQINAFPALVVFLGILTGLVFALAVRPATVKGSSPLRVAALGGLAFVGVAVFWAGLPAILGVAALVVRPHAPSSGATRVGAVLATVALAAHVTLSFVG